MILEVVAAASKGGGSSPILLFLILGLGVVWLIFIRPQRRKQKLQQSMRSELAIGDEIVTAGGVYGTVTQIDDEDVRIEIAPNVEVRLARRAIAAQLTEHAPEAADEDADPADASDEHESGEPESDETGQPELDAKSDEKIPG